jgi:hypothetical protein
MEMRQSSRSLDSSDCCPVAVEEVDAAVASAGVGVPCVFVASGLVEQDDKRPTRKLTVVKMRRIFVMPSRGALEIFISLSSKELFKWIGTLTAVSLS